MVTQPRRKYFVHDPEGDGFSYFATEKERDDFAQDCIGCYLDDGCWANEVENVVSGVLTHTTQQVDRVDRPHDSELDDEFCDNEGNDWNNEFTHICNYKLVKI